MKKIFFLLLCLVIICLCCAKQIWLTIQATTGGTVKPEDGLAVCPDDIIHISATANTGYIFKCWIVISGSGVSFGNCTRPETTVTLSRDDVVIRAKFIKIPHSPSPAPDTSVKTPAPQPSASTPVPPSTSTPVPPSTPTPVPPSTPTPIPTPEQYLIITSVNPPQGGRVLLEPPLSHYPAGTQLSLCAQAEPGFLFQDWEGEWAGNSNPFSITVTTPMEIGAVFTQLHYNMAITVDPPEAAEIHIEPENGSYCYGENITLTLSPNPGYAFDGWSGALSGTELILNFPVIGNITAAAVFRRNTYTVSLTKEGRGTVTHEPVKNCYFYGEKITLTAIPDNRNIFVGWTGDFTGTANPAEVPVTGNMNIGARFAPETDRKSVV